MSHRILLADDSLTIQKVVELTFSESDYQLRTVSSGDKALAVLDDFRPELVLADVVMPGLSGYEVCEAVKRRPEGKYVPVVLLTGTFEPFDRARAERAGCDGIVTKPFDSQALSQTVAELLFKAALARLADQSKKPEPPSAAAFRPDGPGVGASGAAAFRPDGPGVGASGAAAFRPDGPGVGSSGAGAAGAAVAPTPAPQPFADLPPAVSPVVPPPAPPGEGGDLYATTVLRIPNVQEMLEAERLAEASRQAASGAATRVEASFEEAAGATPVEETPAEGPGLPSWLEPGVPTGGLSSPWEEPPFPGGAEMTVAIQAPRPSVPLSIPPAAPMSPAVEVPPPPDATVAIPLPAPPAEELLPPGADAAPTELEPPEPLRDVWGAEPALEPPPSPEPPPFVSGEETVAIVRPDFSRLPPPADQPAVSPASILPAAPRERETLPGLVVPGVPIVEPESFRLAEEAEEAPQAEVPEPEPLLASAPPDVEPPLDEAPPLSLQIPMPILDDTSPTLRGRESSSQATVRPATEIPDVWGAPPPRIGITREPLAAEPEALEMEAVPEEELPVSPEPPSPEAVTLEPELEAFAEPPVEGKGEEDLFAHEPPLPPELESTAAPVAEALGDEQLLQAPPLEEPAPAPPVLEEPAVEAPVSAEPLFEEPVLEEPVLEEPALEEAVLEPPASEEAASSAWEAEPSEPVGAVAAPEPAPEEDLFANEPPLPPELQAPETSASEPLGLPEPPVPEPSAEDDVFGGAPSEEVVEEPRRRKRTTTLGSYEEDEDVVTRDLDEDMEAFERTGGVTPRPAELWEQMEVYAQKQRDDETPSDTSAPDVEDLDAVAARAPLSALVPAIARPSEPAPEAAVWDGTLSEQDVDRIARRVVELLADRIVREVAWDVVPELAERLVRQRLAELERGE